MMKSIITSESYKVKMKTIDKYAALVLQTLKKKTDRLLTKFNKLVNRAFEKKAG